MAEIKRKQGQEVQAYILVESSPGKIDIIHGQSGMSENFTNNTQEVSGLKEAGVSEDVNVAYVTRSDGTRDATWSIQTVALAGEAEAATQKALLEKLKNKKDTTTILFIGDTEPPTGEDKDVGGMMFTGTQYTVLVASVSNDYPYGADITGTIELQHKGTVKPIEHDGSKTFAEILAEINSAA